MVEARSQKPEAALANAQSAIDERNEWDDQRQKHWRLQQAHEHEWAVPTIRLLQHVPPTRVLDIGCGYGTLATAAHMCGHEVVAVDLFVAPPQVPGIDWVRRDVQEPGALPAGPFGVVIMTEVLEHLSVHPGGVMKGIAARLTPDGWFVGSVPDPNVWREDLPYTVLDLPQWDYEHLHRDAHMCAYPKAVLVDLFREAGMDALAIYNIGIARARYYWMARGRRA